MDAAVLLIGGLAAVAVLLLAVAFSSYGSAGDVDDRIQRYGSGKEALPGSAAPRQNFAGIITGSDTLAAFNKAVEQRGFGANLARDLARADLQLKVSEFLMIWATVIIAVPIGFLVLSSAFKGLGQPIALLGAVLLGFFLPRWWLRRREAARLNAFNVQLPDTVVLIANALRSGSSFLQACELVIREEQQPIAGEFGRVVREVNLGLPFEMALDNMVRRIKSDDFSLMAQAIGIQYQVGGNLAEILDTIAFTIRERVRIKGEIQALTSQQRLSGYIVGFLPVGLAGFLFIAAPNFLAPMFRKPPELLGLPAGVIMLIGGGLMMLTGFAIIRRIVDIDV